MYSKKSKEPVWIMILRLALACVFIFSGLMKAIDPVASAIKIDEYFHSFRMDFMHPFSMFFGVVLSTVEFMLGFMMLFKIKMKLTSIFYMLFMGFFLLLTAWLAIAEHLEIHYGYNFGIVKDCGCFGKAVEMSNLETFIKNIILMIPTVIILIKRKSIPDIKLTELGKWCLAGLGFIVVCVLQIYCYRHLPVIDFSDWKKGEDIAETFIGQPAEKKIVFSYRSTADTTIIRYITADELTEVYDTEPDFDKKFKYVNRKDSIIKSAIPPKIEGFSMIDSLGGEHSYELLNVAKESCTFILFMHDLMETNVKGLKNSHLKDIIAYCNENEIDFVGLTNSSFEEINDFTSKIKIDFPIYNNTIDPIKGPFMVRDAIRSNPGLILIKNGVVISKWAWRDIPEVKEINLR